MGENFGKLQAKLHLAKKTLANLSPASIAFSDIASNWQIKLWQICSKSPNFSPANIFRYTVCDDCSIRVLEMHDCCIRVTALLEYFE